MKITDIANLINAEIIHMPEGTEIDIKYAGSSDLMSDVLAYLSEMPKEISREMLLITGLVSPQSIRTAALTDISSVVFTRGKKPNDLIVEAARNSNLALMSTPLTSYNTCGILFKAGIKGVDDIEK